MSKHSWRSLTGRNVIQSICYWCFYVYGQDQIACYYQCGNRPLWHALHAMFVETLLTDEKCIWTVLYECPCTNFQTGRTTMQLFLMPKLPSICIYVCTCHTVSYGHVTRGLKVISVDTSMASSCSIYLYYVLNSWFRLLPIFHSTCGGHFGDWLRQVGAPFSAPSPRQIPSVHEDAGQNSISYPKMEAW